MYRKIVIVACLAVLLSPVRLTAEPKNTSFERAQDSIQLVLEEMSGLLNRFEEYQHALDLSGRDNKAYDEEKNMWMSAVLVVTTIAAVCEYENDLLSLFVDLKPQRRSNFYDVRIQSLNSSIQQIKIMKEQFRINYTLISIQPGEKALFEEINRTIDVSLSLFTASLKAITEMKESAAN